MRRTLPFVALLALAAPLGAQPVPEGIHRYGGPDDRICGEPAADVPALEARLAGTLERLAGNERYRAYRDEANYRVWTFTTPAHPAHPAVACRSVFERDGAVFTELEIVCHSSRENCDALYREFEALDEQLRAALGAGR